MLRMWANAPSLSQKYYLKYLSEEKHSYHNFKRAELYKIEESLLFKSNLAVKIINKILVQPNYHGLQIINKNLLSNIKEFIKIETQEIPIIIDCKDGKTDQFVLLNVLRVEKLVDIENSSVSYYSKKMGGGVEDIENYHTLDDKMPETAFVREADYLPVVYVHPTIADYLLKKNLKYTFLPLVNDYFD